MKREERGQRVPALATRRNRPDDVMTLRVAPLHLLPTERAPEKQHIVAVTFRTDEGRHWHAVGDGATIAAAVEWARESCPDDAVWEAETWNDLYGD
jgi:hypothetical protein